MAFTHAPKRKMASKNGRDLLQSRASRFVCAGFTAGLALTSSTYARADAPFPEAARVSPSTLTIPDPDEGLVVVERSHDPQWKLGRGFETECTTPCTITLDRTAAYRVTGPRFEATPPLKLAEQSGSGGAAHRTDSPRR